MANQLEESIWEPGVYRFETTDVVEGGIDGIDNQPLRQLANRTLFLKDQAADMQTEINNLDDKIDEEILDRIAAINAILPFIPKYRGYITGVNPGAGSPGDSISKSGNISACTVVSSAGNATTYLCTIPSMGGTNYFVRMSVESRGDIADDHDCGVPVFKVISQTQFQISIADVVGGSSQNLRIHCEMTNL